MSGFKSNTKPEIASVQIVKTVPAAKKIAFAQDLQAIADNLSIEDISLLAKVAKNAEYRNMALGALRQHIN